MRQYFYANVEDIDDDNEDNEEEEDWHDLGAAPGLQCGFFSLRHLV